MISATASAGLVRAAIFSLLLIGGVGCDFGGREDRIGDRAAILIDEAHFNPRMSDLEPFVEALADAGYSVIGSRDPITRAQLEDYSVVAIVGAVRTDIHNSVAFAPDGRTIALAGEDYSVNLWDVRTFRQAAVLRSSDWVGSIAFARDGGTLATANAGFHIELWDVQSRSRKRLLSELRGNVRALAFSPDGRTLAAAGDHHNIYLWDTQSGQRLFVLVTPDNAIHSIAFSPDGHYLASGGTGGTINLWNLTSGEPVANFAGASGMIRSVVYSPNGRVIASAGDRPNIELWDVEAGEHLMRIGSDAAVHALAFSPDGKSLASGGQTQAVRLWDSVTGKAKAEFSGHRDWIWSIAFSPNGQMLASVDEDDIANVWDVRTGKLLRSIEGRMSFDWDRGFALSDQECDALHDWVLEGGGLLLVTDHAPYGAAVANLAERFGVTLSNSHPTQDSLHYDPEPVSRVFTGSGNKGWLSFTRQDGLVVDHPVTTGRSASERVDRVATFNGNSLAGPKGSTSFLPLSPTAVDVLENDMTASAAGRSQGLALDFGRGRVVVLGEMGMLMILDRSDYDNRRLALNIVRWLAHGFSDPDQD